ncbi:50S ribosomal protein L32 [Cardinium endosymbiont of Culicoides punctatus]|uniref:50S ribosomal protein L32 n=1 Tax=Cardinium endosymbiont of Culicoides punctatus TaxID=2304601 RepID=UPI001058AFDF|nr:50S ribosomal protein L32 [Cardinium endosymbiont of Culicoides punctatus]TDG95596.1 50S ribosomal protein L32 [Cardinium endosymbiont of Culicoides punctatus]
MAHPKKRSSASRRNKRRTHIKLAMPALVVCPVTGVVHTPHRAFWHEDKMYYKGRVVISKEPLN